MAVRYFFEFSYLDTLYRGEFSNDAYTDSAIELTGSASFSKDLSGNIAQPIQAKAVNVNLLATVDQPLEDIWNEDDRYWLFTLFEAGRAIFQGYASTEDMEQSYTSNKWFLNFDCLDHLSYLEDFGYYDSAGLPYSGNANLLTIMRQCIDRGFNGSDPRLAYLTALDVQYNSSDLLTEVYLDQGQFYNEDGEAESCLQVLEDILKSIGAFIVQWRLNYVIIGLNNYVKTRTEAVTYRQYNSSGVLLSSSLSLISGDDDIIGSEVNNYTTHFISANQSFIRKKFYNTFRVRHDFVYNEQLLSDFANWTLTNATLVGDNLDLDDVELVSQVAEAARAPSFEVKAGDVLVLTIDATYTDDPTEQNFELRLTNTLSGNDYSYRFEQLIQEQGDFAFGDWATLPISSGQDKIEFKPVEGDNTHELTLAEVPEDGDLTFYAYTGVFGSAQTASSNTRLTSVNITSEQRPIEAEEYTYRRTDKNTGEVPEVYEVRFNTSDRSILVNTFLDVNGDAIPVFTTPITEINYIMANYIALTFMSLFQTNYIEFSGDIKNNFDFYPKELNNLGSHFIVVSESKDFTRNISGMTLTQVSPTELDAANYSTEVVRIFRESIKPTIES